MRIKRALIVATAAIGTMLGTASSASAVCNPGTNGFCLYYNSNYGGSYHKFDYGDVANLAGYNFTSPGSGQGQTVKNNAASGRNGFAYVNVRVYFNSNYSGPSDYFTPGVGKNLVNTYNENASIAMSIVP